MKNNSKFIGIAALLAAMVFSMLACGDDGGGTDMPANTPVLTMAPSPVTWTPVGLGYSAQSAQTVTITNHGDVEADISGAISLSGANATSFTLGGTTSPTSIAPGDSSTFTVTPNTGLAIGTYIATVSVTYEGGDVTSETATVNVIFEVRNVFTVTFNSNGGSAVSPITNVISGTTINAPTAPTITTPLAGLYTGALSSPPTPSFVEWRAPSASTAFDFGNTPITADITLTAQWTDTGLIGSVAVNNVTSAVAHIKANAGEYTLFLDSSTSINTNLQTLDVANVKLTIIGLGAVRTIQLVTDRTLFTINASGASLTLGENITLQGIAEYISPGAVGAMINVSNGSLTMLSGSKITGHNAAAGGAGTGAVNLTGSSSFTMDGGEITINRGGNGASATGAVIVGGTSTFTMNGGSITNNRYGSGDSLTDGNPSDVRRMNTATIIKTGGTIGWAANGSDSSSPWTNTGDFAGTNTGIWP